MWSKYLYKLNFKYKKMKKLNITICQWFYAMLIIVSVSCSQSVQPILGEDLKLENDLLEGSNNKSVITISKDTLRIPIVHHISRNSAGFNAVVTEQVIAKVMRDINANYKPGKIQFFTKEIKFLDDNVWNIQFIKQDDFNEKRLLKPFEDENALNLFYFKRLLSNGNRIGATALFPNQGNNVKLSESSVAPDNTATITHEIGHYLGVYHVDDNFRDSQGRIELVDGSNCTEAGDKICDTPASPRLTDSNVDSSTCEYIGTETDPAGVRYSPNTFNFMTSSGRTRSNSEGLCRRRFSQGQIDKMVSVLENERSYLITRE